MTRRHTFLLFCTQLGPLALVIGAGVGFAAATLYAASIAVSESNYWTMVAKGVLVVVACVIALATVRHFAERHLAKRGLLPPHYWDE